MDDAANAKVLSGFVYGLSYFTKRGYGMVELEVLCAIKMMCLEAPNYPPSAANIATRLRLPACTTTAVLQALEDNSLVHREIPKYGDLAKSTYRLAAKGGTMMKKVLQP